MSYIAALTAEEKSLVKHIYGFAPTSYTPRFDGAKYIYELDEDASPLHFEVYVTACSDLVASSNKQPGKRLSLLIALQVKAGLIGQPTYHLTKPVLDSWDVLLRTHIEVAQLDLFIAQIRYTLRRDLKMDFWVRVFDSLHQRPEEDIKTLHSQLDILLDAFCWAKLVMSIMDGIPGVKPEYGQMKEQDKLLVLQRSQFRDYASDASLRHLWGLHDPIELVRADSTQTPPSNIGITSTGAQVEPGEMTVPSYTPVSAGTWVDDKQQRRVVITPSKTRTGASYKPSASTTTDSTDTPSTSSTAKTDSDSTTPSASASAATADPQISDKVESKSADGSTKGLTSPVTRSAPVLIQYLSPYASVETSATSHLRDLATFAVAQLAEPFRMDSTLVVPQRRAVVNIRPAAYRNEVLRICGSDTRVKLHNFFGPEGTPLRTAPTRTDWINSLGDYAAIVTERPRNGQDWSVPPEDVRRLPFTEAFKVVVLKRALHPRFRKVVFPKGYPMWHPQTLDAAWSRLYAAEAQQKAKVAVKQIMNRQVSSPSDVRPPSGIVGKVTVNATRSQPRVPQKEGSSTPGGRTEQKAGNTTTREKQRTEGKEQVCHQFSRGHCPRGDTCRFSHKPRQNYKQRKQKQQSSNTLTVMTPTPPAASYPTQPAPIQQPVTLLGTDWSQYRIQAYDRAVHGLVIRVKDGESTSHTFNTPVKTSSVKPSKRIPSLDGDKIYRAFNEDPVETIAYLDSAAKNNLRQAHLRTTTTGDKVFKLIVDTGAEASMVSAEQVRFFFANLPVLPTKVSLVGALSQDPLSVIHRICITLIVSLSPLAVAEHWFLIVPGLTVEFLLGMDFLTRYKCHILCEGLQVSLLVGTKPAYPVTLFRQGEPQTKKGNSVVGMVQHKRKVFATDQEDTIPTESKEDQAKRERVEEQEAAKLHAKKRLMSQTPSSQPQPRASSTQITTSSTSKIVTYFHSTSSTTTNRSQPLTTGTVITPIDISPSSTSSPDTRSTSAGVVHSSSLATLGSEIAKGPPSPTHLTPKRKVKPRPRSPTDSPRMTTGFKPRPSHISPTSTPRKRAMKTGAEHERPSPTLGGELDVNRSPSNQLTPKRKAKPLPKSPTTSITPSTSKSDQTIPTPNSIVTEMTVFPNTEMWAAAYGVTQRVPPSPLSAAKQRCSATSIIAKASYQYPRNATFIRNIQTAPTQEYLQHQLDAWTTAQDAIAAELVHPQQFTHPTLGSFPATARSPYHPSRRFPGHLSIATFQQIPLVSAAPPHQLNAKPLFYLVVGDPRFADGRLRELRDLVCERMNILEPLSARPNAPELTPVEQLELVQGAGAVVAQMPLILVDQNNVRRPIPWDQITPWPLDWIEPKEYNVHLALRLYENGKALGNILTPSDLIPKFSFTQVSELFPITKFTDKDESYIYLYAWTRLFEMFGTFASEPFWYPLAFLWQTLIKKTSTGFEVIEYKLESQEHSVETFASYNLWVMSELLTPSFREAAASAILFPSLLAELEATATIHLRMIPDVIPLSRADPNAKIQAIKPGRCRTLRFRTSFNRQWRPNTFYTYTWLPFADTYFSDVEIVTNIIFIGEDPPTCVDIQFKNMLDTIVILPFRIPLIGATPALDRQGQLDPTSIPPTPGDDDEDRDNDNGPKFDGSHARSDMMIPSAIRLFTPLLDDIQSSNQHHQSQTCIIQVKVDTSFRIQCHGLWVGDEAKAYLDAEDHVPISFPDINPMPTDELFEQLNFEHIPFVTMEHKQMARNFLQEFADCFVLSGNPPLSKLPAHRIDTGDHPPMYQHLRRLSPERDVAIRTIVAELLKHDIIQPSCSPWASPPHLVKNKDGSFRLTIDYKKLNEVTTKDRYPLPRIADVIDSLEGKKIFSTMDLSKGYWAVPIRPEDIPKTAFLTKDGLYEWKRMPFGLCNAPATFQRCINTVFAGMLWISMTAYIDDITVGSTDFMGHIRILREVFLRLRTWGLRMKAQKCKFFQTQVEVLGFRLSAQGKQPTDRLIKAVRDFPIPVPKQGIKAIQSFLGLINYYACFIPNLASIAYPIRRLTRDNVPWEWGVEQQQAFEQLKLLLTTAPVLRLPHSNKEYILYTDASLYGLGAALHQIFEDGEHPIGYASRTLSKLEQKWPIRDLEALAILWAYDYFLIYLEGVKVTIYTDHQSLKWIMEPTKSSRIQRWALRFMEIRHLIEVRYRAGEQNVVADALSRAPLSASPHLSMVQSSTELQRQKCSDVHPALVPAEFYCHLHAKKDNRNLDSAKITITYLLFTQIIPHGNRPTTLPDTLEFRNLQAAQEQDELYQYFRDALSNEPPHPWTKLQQEARDNFILIDDLLCLKDTNGTLHRICIPSSLRADILYMFHDSPVAAHIGRDKMTELIRKRFYWVGWQKDIATWIKECPQCQKGKATRSSSWGQLQPKNIAFPWEIVSIDILGPLPPSKNKVYILTMVDCFTRFCILVPLKTRTAISVAEALFLQLVCTFSVPRGILTDQGPEFESLLIKHVCQRLGLKKLRTTTYHPQTNGTAERLHRYIKYTLRTLVEEKARSWTDFLPYVAFAYNSTPVAGIGFCPFELVFGRPPTLPADILRANPSLFEEDFHRFNLLQTKRLRDMFELVRKHQTERNEKVKARYDASHKPIAFKIGDLALVYRPADNPEQFTKLHSPYQGPFKVIKIIDQQVYELQALNNPENVVRANIQNLRPYFPRLLYQTQDDEEVTSDTDDEQKQDLPSLFEDVQPTPQTPSGSDETEDSNLTPEDSPTPSTHSTVPQTLPLEAQVAEDAKNDDSLDELRRILPDRQARPTQPPQKQRKPRSKRAVPPITHPQEVTANTDPIRTRFILLFAEDFLMKYFIIQDFDSEDNRPYVGQLTKILQPRLATVWLFGPRQHWRGGLANIHDWVWYPAYVDLRDNKAVFSKKPLRGHYSPWFFDITTNEVVSEPFRMLDNYRIPRRVEHEIRSYMHPPLLAH